MSQKIIQIPDPPAGVDDETRDWMLAVINQLNVVTGSLRSAPGDRAPTKRELVEAGVPNADRLFLKENT